MAPPPSLLSPGARGDLEAGLQAKAISASGGLGCIKGDARLGRGLALQAQGASVPSSSALLPLPSKEQGTVNPRPASQPHLQLPPIPSAMPLVSYQPDHERG